MSRVVRRVIADRRVDAGGAAGVDGGALIGELRDPSARSGARRARRGSRSSRRRDAHGTPTRADPDAGLLPAFGRFLRRSAPYAPIAMYLAWVPYVLSVSDWRPTAAFDLGVAAWSRWAVGFVLALWPYFSDFILTSTFVVLVAPLTLFVLAVLLSNRAEAATVARAAAAAVATRARPVALRRVARRCAEEAAAFPAAFAEALGRALLPGGMIHAALERVTDEVASYPAAVAGELRTAARRVARGAGAFSFSEADFAAGLGDAANELLAFPELLLEALAPGLRDLAPIGEVFVGAAAPRAKGEVPDLAAFARVGEPTATPPRSFEAGGGGGDAGTFGASGGHREAGRRGGGSEARRSRGWRRRRRRRGEGGGGGGGPRLKRDAGRDYRYA
jgi:hypothetical protein